MKLPHFTKPRAKAVIIAAIQLLLCYILPAQELFRYNHSDTIIPRITAPFFVSDKLVYFDTSYVEKKEGGSVFKIGKVCAQIGCDGSFEATGKTQAGWWLIENKIIICFLTPLNAGAFRAELRVWRYNTITKRFDLLNL